VRRRAPYQIPFFKYILYVTGLIIIASFAMRAITMKIGMEIMDQFCDANHKYADTYRLPGGTKGTPKDVLGCWKLVKRTYQEKYFDDPERSFYTIYERYRPTHYYYDSSFCYYFREDFSEAEQYDYKIDSDSLIIDYGNYSHSHYYEFHGDTLVLISTPNGHCWGADYDYYLRNDSILNVKDSIAKTDE
jgi:hypothetical protein